MADILVAQYFQQVPPPQLSLPDGPTLLQPAVQTSLYERMFADTDTNTDADPDTGTETGNCLPPASYQTRVLKMIITRLEESISDPEDEIIEPLMDAWSNLLAQPKPSSLQQAQQLAYITYTAPPPDRDSDSDSDSDSCPARTVITSESRGLILSSGTTGFRTWEAALHLGTYLASSQTQFHLQGKRVLELGAGTGFLSLFVAKHLNPEIVVATDREPALIESISDCAQKNHLREGVLVPGLWEWGTSSSFGDMEFDIALGADLIYDQDLIPLLLSTLTVLFTRNKRTHFLISATLRNMETFQAFLNACETNGLHVKKLGFESPPEERQRGFFHSTGIPIESFVISSSGLESE